MFSTLQTICLRVKFLHQTVICYTRPFFLLCCFLGIPFFSNVQFLLLFFFGHFLYLLQFWSGPIRDILWSLEVSLFLVKFSVCPQFLRFTVTLEFFLLLIEGVIRSLCSPCVGGTLKTEMRREMNVISRGSMDILSERERRKSGNELLVEWLLLRESY